MGKLNTPYSRVFAIGDIHGCSKTFRKLLYNELLVTPDDLLICVGDYVDRGPDSRGVVDSILDLRQGGFDVVTLRGNHEQIMIESDESNDQQLLWLRNGGAETLKSFGAGSYAELETQYKTFFEETLFYYEWKNSILVHAGLNYTDPDPLTDRHAMLWSREQGYDRKWLGDRVVIHGHTPLALDAVLQQDGPLINIDAGCVYPHRQGMGWLVALELVSTKFFAVENAEDRN